MNYILKVDEFYVLLITSIKGMKILSTEVLRETLFDKCSHLTNDEKGLF